MKKFRAMSLGVLALAIATPMSATAAQPARSVAATSSFTLNASVLDGGQQVTSITINTGRLHIDPRSVGVDTFQVHATGTNPYKQLDPASVMGTYDQYRTVTGARLDGHGNIVLTLAHGPDAPAASTFAWGSTIGTGVVGRNVRLDLAYAVTERLPLKASGHRLMLHHLTQGQTVDPEVDAFTPGTSSSGLNYRIFRPADARRTNRRPLIVWLHGGGEGGWSGAQDTALPLIANRGALGFTTPAAQRAFGGAFVVAPQATDYWMHDKAMGYTAKLKSLIDQLLRTYPINSNRIYVVGASNGGYQTLALESAYPRFFAAGVPTCPGVVFQGTQLLSAAQLARIAPTPTWIVQASNDPVLPFPVNGKYAHEHIAGSRITVYPDVVWNGHTYLGHWSWIYVAHNDPALPNGTHLFQWMARQHR